MRNNPLLILLLSACLAISCNTHEQSAPNQVHYTLVQHWPALPAGFVLGNPTGIGIDTSGNVLVFHRAGRTWPLISPMPDTYITGKTVLVIDRVTGTLLNSWGDSLFIMPHGLTVDKDNNVWLTDVGLHQVFKFSHEGKLLLKLGEARVSGDDKAHFNRPTDVAVAPDGSFYVSDGYRNSRVVKFSASGQYLFEWGTKGSDPGEFHIPHGICLDEKGNVYVADRENKRVQVFDSIGKFIQQWNGHGFGNMCSVTYDSSSKHFVAVDDHSLLSLKHTGSDVLGFTATGTLLTRFGKSGGYDGPVCWYHDVAVDKNGNIYVVDILGNTLQKFEKE